MRQYIFAFMLVFSLMSVSDVSLARPVSYPGGWTLMLQNDGDANSSHIHYSPTAKYSVGWRHEYMRGSDANADYLQGNILLKRWNKPDSQANLYSKTGIGVAYDGDDAEAAAFTGIAADWENRRFFTSYENKFSTAGDFASNAEHKARIGITPYIGDYGDLHTWLMLQADYNPERSADEELSFTPLVRFFKSEVLLEAGYNVSNETALFNFVYRY